MMTNTALSRGGTGTVDGGFNTAGAEPLLAASGSGGGGGGGERWWWKAVDVAEAKEQIVLAVPMVLTNVFYYLIPLVSVMFAGRLGQLQLAGSTLANSWATVSGFAFMLGLSGALETLCGQGFGAQLYEKLGIYLQSSCIISFLFSIVISIIWWYTEPILIFLHQNPEISKEAAIYMRFLIPGIFAFGILQNIVRFLQTQSVVAPLVVCSSVPLLLHLGLNYWLVYYTRLGYRGAPLATSITFWVSVVILLVYVGCDKRFARTWKGLSKESFAYIGTNLKLALPSAAMVCLEYWAFEILVLLAGLTVNAKTTTSVIAMCVNTENVAYNFTYGLSASTSTRVSNELGAGRANQAKHAMGVAMKLSILLGLIILLVLSLGHDSWASLFSDNPTIIEAFASMTPLLCISIFFDSIQGILSGVSRGCGWQQLAVYINLGTFYIIGVRICIRCVAVAITPGIKGIDFLTIGMPITYFLAFKVELYAKGLWIGLICGLVAHCGSLFVLTRFHEWTTLEISPDGKENSALG